MAKKKVAVIGSGIAGSGIAALLAHSGDYEVDLYEKNGLIGGRFASYGKEGFRLEIGTDDLMALEEELTSGRIPDEMEYMMVPIVSNVDPTACPEGRQLIIAGTGTGEPGKPLPRDREKWAQAYLKGLEHVFPGIGEHVLWAAYTSPEDINNLFGEEGNVIGIGQKLGQVGEDRPPIGDPEIENLYHCSADTGMHGIGGELAADSALRLYRMLVG